jgi:N-methylhydantoinase B
MRTAEAPLPEVDPVTFEVIKHRLWQTNDEQSIAIRTISSSPIVVEGNDSNVGLFSEDVLSVREVRRTGTEG